MKNVQTVLGEVAPSDLGFVLPHEHVFLDIYDITLNSNMIFSDRVVARRELEIYKEKGGNTIIDQTVHGLNADPEALRDVAADVGINIVAGTGFYWERFHPPWLADMSEADIVRLMVSDLTVGFAGTDVRAGVIGEIGTHHREISPAEERVIRACSQTQQEVGVPIATHSLFTRIGMAQAQAFESAGADLDKLVIGHVDTNPDVDYHEELLQFGVWIAYDSIGQLDKQSDERRADAIVELIGRGYRDRILLSTDVGKRAALHAYGGNGYDHTITNFLPLLAERGLSQVEIDHLTKTNPQTLFSFPS